jgi:hypothetical protein
MTAHCRVMANLGLSTYFIAFLAAIILAYTSSTIAQTDGQLSQISSAATLTITLVVYQRPVVPAFNAPAGFFNIPQSSASDYPPEKSLGKAGTEGPPGLARAGKSETLISDTFYVDNPAIQKWLGDRIASKGEATLSLCTPKGGGSGQSLGIASASGGSTDFVQSDEGGGYSITVSAGSGNCPSGSIATSVQITLTSDEEPQMISSSVPIGEYVRINLIVVPG